MPRDNLLELFDVCDADDRVVSQAPRGEVHARGWLHRAVHIWVFNSAGDLLLHRRSATKDEYPLCYTSSASGHLNAGEDYGPAAERELAEELGLTGELERLVKLPAGPETASEHTVLFRSTSDVVPKPDPDEIESIEYLAPAVVTDRMTATPEQFSPPFRALWNWFVSHQNPDASS
ncbi:MAG: NUDIX domain-containing protein [Planctomycetaceae bacterium]|nr:NUDIX domain-containing protein [Planctomycetaceae bacterium]